MKKFFLIRAVSLFLILLLAGAIFSIPSFGAENQPSMDHVTSVCVVNVKHRIMVLHKDEHKIVYPASTAKLMTALVVHDTYKGRLQEEITVTKEMLDATKGRFIGFSIGETISVEDLLYAMLIGGYNDATNILAFSVAGGVEQFCQLMNQKAAELGAASTHYTNPTGIHHDSMVTTAYDTALISIAVRENTDLFTITKAVKHKITTAEKLGDFTLYNRNYLIATNVSEDYFYTKAEGMNAGETDEGGFCVVTSGKEGKGETEEAEYTYVCVVMGGEISDSGTNYAYKVAKNTLRYALINYSVMRLKSHKSIVATIPVDFSATDYEVDVKLKNDLTSLIHSGVDIEKDIKFVTEINHKRLNAPIKEGQVVGSIKAYYKGALLDETELITTRGIDSHGFLVFMHGMKKLTQNPLFFIPFLLGVAGLIYYKVKTSGGKKPQKKRKRKYYN
ncbi:MAG: D-alanyl-D-alanine carboxypeptidase [Clostridia bacterium]|nr:D-alanyl-D-alanine carboxypeptidase [Clostridia bacterium]